MDTDLKSPLGRIGDRSLTSPSKILHREIIHIIALVIVIVILGFVLSMLVSQSLGLVTSKSREQIRGTAFSSLQTVKGYSIIITQN